MTQPRRAVCVGPDMPARLDALVRRLLPDLSRRLIRTLLAEGAITVNGRIAVKGARIAAGDVVEVPALEGLAPEPDHALTILYEDADMVAVDKPGGVPGHALDPRQRGTIAGALLARYPELARVGDPLSAGLVHRLDTGTSGVLVAARSNVTHQALREAFRRRAVTKHYLAIVDGAPMSDCVVDTPLAHDPGDRRRMRAAHPGDRAWPARTEIGRVVLHGPLALVELTLRTGVTHQARAHLALAGCPIVGDEVYGGSVRLPAGRHALHALRLEVPDRALELEAPFPADLGSLLA